MEKYIAPDRKRIPYGMMNFAVIRRDDCYYVDKTRFIPMIEEADKFFFFIRPRRFGKSLTVNMLQHYYDILAKDKFEALFGDLYIGKHPTRDRNSYLVLYLNFSGIVGELHNYRKGLDAHCQTMFDYFCDIYADYLPKGIKEELDKKEGAVEQFEYLFTECNKTNQRIYLFIDEYDHFTNAILSDIESLHRYTDETHGEGYLRAFSVARPYAPDTRGVCFQGPSRALWYFKHPARRGSRAVAGEGMKSEVYANARLHVHHALLRAAGAAVSHCCVAQ